jgi:adenylate kinase
MINIVLFGPPGAGKGTQSELIRDKFKLIHISTGDIFRREIKNATELGLKAKSYMDEGRLVPDEVVIGMIEKAIKENRESAGVILDGFPRTTAQAGALDEVMERSQLSIDGMIMLDVAEKELIERIKKRGETSGRSDDTDDTIIQQRIEEYENKTKPVAEYYGKQNKLHLVDGIGSISDIFGRIERIINKLK